MSRWVRPRDNAPAYCGYVLRALVRAGMALVLSTGCDSVTGGNGAGDFNAAVELYARGECGGASLKFREALRRNPDLRESYVYLAECSLRRGDLDGAAGYSREAAPEAAGRPDLGFRLKAVLAEGGRKALDSGNHDLAVGFCREAVSLNPQDGGMRLLLGTALLARGAKEDLKQSIAEFRAAAAGSAEPREIRARIRAALFAQAREFGRQGDAAMQSGCYAAYTENFDPEDAEANVQLGELMLRMGNVTGALHYAKIAYRRAPRDRAVLKLIGDLNEPLEH